MKRIPLTSVVMALTALAGVAQAQEIALTFDDLPSHASLPPGATRITVIEGILAALREARVPPVYGFVNGFRLQTEPEAAPVLRLWREAGYPLANHTWSHLRLDSAAAWTADVARNESLLVNLMGNGDWRWLRYPFLAEGAGEQRAAARNWLAGHNYKIASVTMSFDDWAYNDPYARCMARGDTAAVADLERRWLAGADSALSYYRGLSRTLYGRDIPYVLLMHVGALDARMMPRLLELYRARGVRLVSLDEAERDPFYQDEIRSAASPAAATLENVMRQRGLPVPPKAWNAGEIGQICR